MDHQDSIKAAFAFAISEKAGPFLTLPSLLGDLILIYFLVNSFLLNPTNPTRPEPRSRMVGGMGTLVGSTIVGALREKLSVDLYQI
jgi:hypothetical protein